MIQGVIIKQLKYNCDERGKLAELMRRDDPVFNKFGQVYMTTVYPGVVKAWHYHKKQVDNFIAVKGMIKVVLYDSRKSSKTKGEVNEFFIGEHNFCRITIPKFIYHGFKCISDNEAIIINIPDQMYNYKKPDEYRVDPYNNDIPYSWERKDG